MFQQEIIKQEKINESARLSGLLAIFEIYIDVINDDNNHHSGFFLNLALKSHLENIEKFDFKHYKSEFEKSKIEIEKVLYRSKSSEYIKLKQHEIYTFVTDIYNNAAKIIRKTQELY